MTRVAIYVRVSTEEQKVHGLSIEAQNAALDSWAKEQKLKVVDHYNDAGITARKRYNKRPELVRLLDDVKAKKIDLIIFTKLDRWFRNIAEYYKVQEILEANHVDWKTIHEDYDTSTSSGRLKINIMLAVSQDEADRTSERIKAVFDVKKQNMEPVSGNVPIGYRLNNKTIEFDPEWEPSVRVFFNNFMTYGSSAKARKEVFIKTGKTISYQLAYLMLRNKSYCGRYHDIQGMCPQYVSELEFERIQSMVKTQPRSAPTGVSYIFTGLIYCSECGHRMSAKTQQYNTKSERKRVVFYTCNNHYIRSGCGNNRCPRELFIEEELLRVVPCEISDAIASSDASLAQEDKSHIDVGKLNKKISRLQDLYLNELIEIDEYRRNYNELKSMIDQAEVEKKRRQTSRPILKLAHTDWISLYNELDSERKRAFWCSIISRIEVTKDKQVKVVLI